MSLLITILLIWTIASFILAPFLGRFLKRRRIEQTNHLYPLPSGSIVNHPERVS